MGGEKSSSLLVKCKLSFCLLFLYWVIRLLLTTRRRYLPYKRRGRTTPSVRQRTLTFPCLTIKLSYKFGIMKIQVIAFQKAFPTKQSYSIGGMYHFGNQLIHFSSWENEAINFYELYPLADWPKFSHLMKYNCKPI